MWASSLSAAGYAVAPEKGADMAVPRVIWRPYPGQPPVFDPRRLAPYLVMTRQLPWPMVARWCNKFPRGSRTLWKITGFNAHDDDIVAWTDPMEFLP